MCKIWWKKKKDNLFAVFTLRSVEIFNRKPTLRLNERGSWPQDDTTDLTGQFVHQGHDGVLEKSSCGQRSLGDLSDAQLTIWPHLLQDWVGTTRDREVKEGNGSCFFFYQTVTHLLKWQEEKDWFPFTCCTWDAWSPGKAGLCFCPGNPPRNIWSRQGHQEWELFFKSSSEEEGRSGLWRHTVTVETIDNINIITWLMVQVSAVRKDKEL